MKIQGGLQASLITTRFIVTSDLPRCYMAFVLMLLVQWDTYRTLFPLMSLHDPQRFADIVRGMIDIQRNEGWLPECREMGTKQYVPCRYTVSSRISREDQQRFVQGGSRMSINSLHQTEGVLTVFRW